jgi:hypothetical protein
MRTIIFTLVVAMCCGAGLAAEKDSGLILHYTFGEGADTTVRDKSGHGNDGTITGKVSPCGKNLRLPWTSTTLI